MDPRRACNPSAGTPSGICSHSAGTLPRLLGVGLLVLITSCDSTVAPILPVATTVAPDVGAVVFTSLGATQRLQATVRDQSGTPMTAAQVSWASLDPTVVTVGTDGTVTAVANGVTAVVAASGTTSANIPVTVRQAASVLTLSTDAAAFGSLGDTARIAAVVRDAGGSEILDAALSWLALDPTIATTSDDGLVTAVANGATIIAVTTESLLQSVAVTVDQEPDSVGLSVTSLDFDALGDTTRLVASVWDARGVPISASSVSWVSADTAVASVTESGLVRSVGNGTATVTANAGGVMISTTVGVNQLATHVSFLADSIVFDDIAQSRPLPATVRDRLGAQITAPAIVWTSGDTTVATVDSAGVVTSVAAGSASISASVDGVATSAGVRVVPQLTLLVAGPASVTAQVASQVSLSARVEDFGGAGYGGAAVNWSVTGGGGTIDSPALTPSDANGYVGAVWTLGTGAGLQQASASIQTRGTTVTVTYSASALAAPAVAAFVTADSVLLSGAGETAYLAPTFRDAFGNTATPVSAGWTSDDASVATVSSDGLITGVSAGSAWIRSALGSPGDSVLVTLVPRGAITITFDDGWDETYDNARPVMESFALRGNVGVITGAVDGAFGPLYMDQPQLQSLHDAGWTLVSHTVSHPSLDTLSNAALDYELRTSRQWLVDHGFDRGANIFIAPFHAFNAREKTAASTYYIAARGTSANMVVPDSMVAWKPSLPFDLTAIDMDQLDYTSAGGRAQLRVMLQRTLDEGRFLDILFHKVPAANVSDFTATLAVVNDFRERVLTYHELYPQFARPIF